jgi:hypothetical protein
MSTVMPLASLATMSSMATVLKAGFRAILHRGLAGGAEARVFEDHRHLFAQPPEGQHLRGAQHAAIDADGGRTQPGTDGGGVKEPPADAFRIGAGQGDKDAALIGIHLHRQQIAIARGGNRHGFGPCGAARASAVAPASRHCSVFFMIDPTRDVTCRPGTGARPRCLFDVLEA